MPRTPVPVALTLLLLPLAACESDPPATSATTSSASSAPTTSAPARTAAMTTKEAATFWKAAPKHLKSAYAAAYGKKYDRSALADVFAEPSLSVFTFASRYKQAVKDTDKPGTIRFAPEVLYAGAPGSGAESALSVGRGSIGWGEQSAAASAAVWLRRTSPDADWRVAASVPVAMDRLPEAPDPGAAEPSDADRAWARKAVDAIADYLETGRAKGFTPGTLLTNIHKSEKDSGFKLRTTAALFGKKTDDPTAPGGPVSVWRAGSQIVAIGVIERHQVVTDPNGGMLTYKDEIRKLYRLPSTQAKEGSLYQAVTVLITGKPAGKPTVVAAQSGALMPPRLRD